VTGYLPTLRFGRAGRFRVTLLRCASGGQAGRQAGYKFPHSHISTLPHSHISTFSHFHIATLPHSHTCPNDPPAGGEGGLPHLNTEHFLKLAVYSA